MSLVRTHYYAWNWVEVWVGIRLIKTTAYYVANCFLNILYKSQYSRTTLQVSTYISGQYREDKHSPTEDERHLRMSSTVKEVCQYLTVVVAVKRRLLIACLTKWWFSSHPRLIQIGAMQQQKYLKSIFSLFILHSMFWFKFIGNL